MTASQLSISECLLHCEIFPRHFKLNEIGINASQSMAANKKKCRLFRCRYNVECAYISYICTNSRRSTVQQNRKKYFAPNWYTHKSQYGQKMRNKNLQDREKYQFVVCVFSFCGADADWHKTFECRKSRQHLCRSFYQSKMCTKLFKHSKTQREMGREGGGVWAKVEIKQQPLQESAPCTLHATHSKTVALIRCAMCNL